MRLRPFSHIENSLEFIVERPFAMLFRRTVQPAEVGKRLKRELTSGSLVSVRGRVAPNDFTVLLNPADFQPYRDHGAMLAADLADWLDEVALASNLSTTGVMHVRFEVDETVRKGRMEIHSSVNETDPSAIQFADPGQTEAFAVSSPRTTDPSGFIEICSGPATGAVFPVRKVMVTIGRDLSNDLVIESAEISRFHAELHSSQGRATILDRQSMNGTFVNGYQVVHEQLVEPGDQIMFRSTICRFWRELL